MDRYDYSYDNYIASKFRIIQAQDEKDYCIAPLHDAEVMKKFQSLPTIAPQLLHFSKEMPEKLENVAFLKQDKLCAKLGEASLEIDKNVQNSYGIQS